MTHPEKSSRGQSDESRFEGDDDEGKDHLRPVVTCALRVARGESPPLLAPIDAAHDHIPTGVERQVAGERATRPNRPPSALI